jgi:hypothetical protein
MKKIKAIFQGIIITILLFIIAIIITGIIHILVGILGSMPIIIVLSFILLILVSLSVYKNSNI